MRTPSHTDCGIPRVRWNTIPGDSVLLHFINTKLRSKRALFTSQGHCWVVSTPAETGQNSPCSVPCNPLTEHLTRCPTDPALPRLPAGAGTPYCLSLPRNPCRAPPLSSPIGEGRGLSTSAQAGLSGPGPMSTTLHGHLDSHSPSSQCPRPCSAQAPPFPHGGLYVWRQDLELGTRWSSVHGFVFLLPVPRSCALPQGDDGAGGW